MEGVMCYVKKRTNRTEETFKQDKDVLTVSGRYPQSEKCIIRYKEGFPN